MVGEKVGEMELWILKRGSVNGICCIALDAVTESVW